MRRQATAAERDPDPGDPLHHSRHLRCDHVEDQAQLDRWFLPAKEAWRIAYELDGSPEVADKVSVAVYATNYCTATVEDDGGLTFPKNADLADEVIWSKALDDQAAPRALAYPIEGWKGESEATRGVLKKRDAARYINVACSPYTVVVRFYKDAADKDAHITLAPFWPLFDAGDKATTASLEITWKIAKCTRTLEHGQLLVMDKDGTVVLRQALGKDEIAAGKLAWAAGRDVLTPDRMPYRAQLQARTGAEEANGVALAAMHTEVRLWVHPPVKADPKKRVEDPQRLDFQVAPFVPTGDAPVANSDSWYGLQLAKHGYHPGPIDGDVNADDFKLALKEFQRAYPKKARNANLYRRLAISGTKNADTQAMLVSKMVEPRTLFGEVGDTTLYEPADLDSSAAATRLGTKDHESGLILWVDDRHYYTDGPIPAGCDPRIGLGNYRGAMDQNGDGKVTRDATSINRPWIPLAVRPRLLSRDADLGLTVMPVWDAAMAAAIGPLRVDWTLKETRLKATTEKMAYHYRAAHVHIVHPRATPKEWSAMTLLAASKADLADIVVGACTKVPYTSKALLTPKDNYVWPWAGSKHYGINEIPAPDMTFADYRDKFLDGVFDDTWARFRGPMLTHLLDRVEKTTGRYTGHMLVGFASTPRYYVQVYWCSDVAAHRNLLIEITSQGGSAVGDACHKTGCLGTLAVGYKNSYRCPTCATDYPDREEAVAHSHPTCTSLCPGTKSPAHRGLAAVVNYTCDTCGVVEAQDNQYFVMPDYGCGLPCGGHGTPTVLNQTSSTTELNANTFDGLPLAAVGSGLGASFVFEGDDSLNWAHEMGHHRHMEHAAGAPVEKVAQHDSRDNPALDALVDAKDVEKRWDRACVMGYVDKMFFCGKCILKNRGWKVENIDLPAGDKKGL